MSKAIWALMAAAILLLPANLYAQCCCCGGAPAQQSKAQGQPAAVKPVAAPGAQCPFSQAAGLQAKKADKEKGAESAGQAKDASKAQGK